jgi:DNA-binding NarL/FixJ family response regulator
MSDQALERRPRILVVEDIQVMRESYVDNLEIDDDYYVDAAANLSDALAAMQRRTYHVALVDIMLAGEKDIANRDGVRVLEQIESQGEGTRCIVLTAQRETQLVRDFLRNLNAFDYLDKSVVGSKGFAAIANAIAEALASSPVGREIEWNDVVKVLAGGAYEERFVSDLQGWIRESQTLTCRRGNQPDAIKATDHWVAGASTKRERRDVFRKVLVQEPRLRRFDLPGWNGIGFGWC